jgi:REP element-mobilizing transposase RayT
LVYHVLNRGNGRQALFDADTDYLLFQRILWQAQRRLPMRLIGYCLMPNHWHLLLWPHGDGDLSEFMRWLTVTHTQRWHAIHGTAGAGHLYQGRFKSFPVQVRRPSASQREQGALELGSPSATRCGRGWRRARNCGRGAVPPSVASRRATMGRHYLLRRVACQRTGTIGSTARTARPNWRQCREVWHGAPPSATSRGSGRWPATVASNPLSARAAGRHEKGVRNLFRRLSVFELSLRYL